MGIDVNSTGHRSGDSSVNVGDAKAELEMIQQAIEVSRVQAQDIKDRSEELEKIKEEMARAKDWLEKAKLLAVSYREDGELEKTKLADEIIKLQKEKEAVQIEIADLKRQVEEIRPILSTHELAVKLGKEEEERLAKVIKEMENKIPLLEKSLTILNDQIANLQKSKEQIESEKSKALADKTIAEEETGSILKRFNQIEEEIKEKETELSMLLDQVDGARGQIPIIDAIIEGKELEAEGIIEDANSKASKIAEELAFRESVITEKTQKLIKFRDELERHYNRKSNIIL
jgi:chromosome segregation ATPase